MNNRPRSGDHQSCPMKGLAGGVAEIVALDVDPPCASHSPPAAFHTYMTPLGALNCWPSVGEAGKSSISPHRCRGHVCYEGVRTLLAEMQHCRPHNGIDPVRRDPVGWRRRHLLSHTFGLAAITGENDLL